MLIKSMKVKLQLAFQFSFIFLLKCLSTMPSTTNSDKKREDMQWRITSRYFTKNNIFHCWFEFLSALKFIVYHAIIAINDTIKL